MTATLDQGLVVRQLKGGGTGCSPKKEVVGRLKQDLDKDLQLHRILILLY